VLQLPGITGIEGRTHEGMGLLLAAGIGKRRSHWGVAEKNPTPTCLAAAQRQGSSGSAWPNP
jgi:hypothetical protein